MVWYRFGDIEIDVDGFVLRRGGVEQPLQPKVFDVLRYLIQHRGRLVTKDELLDHLWPDEYVNEAVVTWSVSHIRRAFGQDRADKTPIETVHRRGYRFTAELVISDAPVVASTGSQQARSPGLVGRDHVVAELSRYLEDAVGGHGTLCALTGEAGIGKTRCTEELMKRASVLGMRTLVGRCPQATGVPPLWPLDGALSAVRDEEAASGRKAIAQLAGHDDPAGSQPRGDSSRFLAIEQVTASVHALAKKQPTLLVVDDLHWADAETLQWLAFIAPELTQSALCIVVALREGETERASPRARALQQVMRHARSIQLSSLDNAAVAELMTAVHEQRPSAELSDAVRRASGGVPLFVLEVARSLAREHGQEQLDRLKPEAVQVPSIARDILRQRFRQLPDATIEVISHAAVIGESFDLSVLASLLSLEPEALLDRLSPAIVEGQIASEAPHTFRFSHGLFWSVLYDDMEPSKRVEIHRKLAKLLEARPERAPLTEIARHYHLSLAAGEPAKVAQVARDAGLAAARRFAFEEASMCLGWALEAQAFGDARPPRERAELLFSLASAQRSAGRTAEATDTAARAIELALQHRLDDLVVAATRMRRPTVSLATLPDPLARAALERVLSRAAEGADAVRISALAQLACVPPYEPDLASSKRLSELAITLAEQLGHRETLFEALRSRLFALSAPADIQGVVELAERILELDRVGPHSWQTMDARIARVSANLLSGRIAAADAALEETTIAVGGVQWGEASFYCQRMRAQRLFLDGRFDDAEQRWLEVRKQGVRAGVSYADAMHRTQLFHLTLEREGARVVLDKHLNAIGSMPTNPRAVQVDMARIAAEAGALELVRTQLAALGDPSDYPRSIGYLHALSGAALCAIALGDRSRCEQLAALLSPYADFNTPDALGYYLGSVSHFLGLLETALGKPDEARSYFERALAQNRAMGYRAGVVRTLLAGGRLARNTGDLPRARQLLEEARTEAESLGMRPALDEATTALR